MREVNRANLLRMAETGGRDQFRQRTQRGAMIIIDPHDLVRHHQRAVARRVLGGHAGGAAVGVTAQRLNTAQGKHETARGIAPVRAKRHGACEIETCRDLAGGADPDAVACIDADQGIVDEADALTHRHSEVIHELGRCGAGAAFIAVDHDEIGIDSRFHHCLADRKKLPAVADAQLEAGGLAARQPPHLADELHHLDRG